MVFLHFWLCPGGLITFAARHRPRVPGLCFPMVFLHFPMVFSQICCKHMGFLPSLKDLFLITFAVRRSPILSSLPLILTLLSSYPYSHPYPLILLSLLSYPLILTLFLILLFPKLTFAVRHRPRVPGLCFPLVTFAVRHRPWVPGRCFPMVFLHF